MESQSEKGTFPGMFFLTENNDAVCVLHAGTLSCRYRNPAFDRIAGADALLRALQQNLEGIRNWTVLPAERTTGEVVDPGENRRRTFRIFPFFNGGEMLWVVRWDTEMETVPEAGQNIYHDLFKSAMLPMVLADADTLRILECNPAFLENYGCTEEEVRSLTLMDLHSPEEKRKGRQLMPLRFSDAKISGETIHVRKDGAVFPVKFYSSPLTYRGRPCRLISFSDISQRKKSESELQEAMRKAEEASRAKSDFLARLSHELRSPMNGIIGMLSLLEQETLTDQQRSWLNVSLHSSDQMLKLIDDLLDISRIETQKIRMENRPFHLGNLLENISLAAERRIKAKGLAFHRDFRLPDAVEYTGDPTRLTQILQNLISNARKFTRSGSIRFGAVLESSSGERDVIRLYVADTGPGIPAEKRHLIFEKFSQVVEGVEGAESGMGLGLAIAQELANLLGSRILLDENPGGGMVFSLTLELSRNRDGKKEPERIIPERKKMPDRILLVEDNSINAMVLKAILENLGFREIEVAADGREAVEACSGKKYDLIFMDISMPIMNGYEAARGIRSLAGASNQAVIIAVTAKALEGEKEKCLECGMNSYLTKPVTLDGVARQLRELSLSPEA